MSALKGPLTVPQDVAKPPKAVVVDAATVGRLIAIRFKEQHVVRFEMQGVSGSGRLDAVAIKTSHSNPDVHGFEIKVSRRDFLQDDKWPAYLRSCKQFWFVTGPKVCTRDEIPEQAGWLEVSTNGAALYLRKKAPVREMAIKDEAALFRRLVYGEYYGKRFHGYTAQGTPDRAQALAEWVRMKDDNAALGRDVAQKVQRYCHRIETESRLLKAQIETVETFRRALVSLGIPEQEVYSPHGREHMAKGLIQRYAPHLLSDIPPELDQFRKAVKALEECFTDLSRRANSALDKIGDALTALE